MGSKKESASSTFSNVDSSDLRQRQQAQWPQPRDHRQPRITQYQHEHSSHDSEKDGLQRSDRQQAGRSHKTAAHGRHGPGTDHPQSVVQHCHEGCTTHCLQDLRRGHQRGENLSPSPAIERYLREGNKKEALTRGDREGYGSGGPGMTSYLQDWQRRWDAIDGKDGRKGW